MSAQATGKRQLKVVAVSPGDVRIERDSLRAVVEELNRGVADLLGIELALWRWERASYPGLHPAGPQGLIDDLMRIEDSDIVIGIFWRRFGTPVADAESGTAHGLGRACASWQRANRPQIMAYFGEKAYSPKDPEEAEQWSRVLRYKKGFYPEAMRWPYASEAEFPNLAVLCCLGMSG